MNGTKHDHGKTRAGLMMADFALALRGVAEVTSYGAIKYAPGNWKKVADKEDRYRDALYRHLLAYEAGEENDRESSLPHLAHAAWNILALLQMRIEQETSEDVIRPEMVATFPVGGIALCAGGGGGAGGESPHKITAADLAGFVGYGVSLNGARMTLEEANHAIRNAASNYPPEDD